jgi:hypothetical protein
MIWRSVEGAPNVRLSWDEVSFSFKYGARGSDMPWWLTCQVQLGRKPSPTNLPVGKLA